MEKKLLDLTLEYAAAKDSEAWSAAFPGESARTLDDIASEYGRTLRAFLG